MKKHVLVALAAAAVLAGCSSDEPGNNFRGKIIEVPSGKDVTLSRAETEVAGNITLFANDLFHAASDKYSDVFEEKNGNMSISPLSASIALAMAANTGDESVGADVARMLHCDDLDLLNSTCNKLMRLITTNDKCEVTLANSMWYNMDYTPVSELIDDLNDLYYAEVADFDAMNEPETLDMINGWIASKTRGHITEMIDHVDNLSIAFFINALYFNGTWSDEFSESKTTDEDFNGTLGTQRVRMMHKNIESTGNYGETDNVSFMSLPYEGGKSMWLVLPAEGVSVEELSRNFDFSCVQDQSLRRVVGINLAMPKFKVNSSSDFLEIFKSLGFNACDRYFPKLGTTRECDINAWQKTMVDVNEKGTEMAAATVVEIGFSSAGGAMTKKDFILNRPFIYFVTDDATGAILMAGRICNL